MLNAFTYARSLSLPLLVIMGFYAGGWWNFITPAACFILHPLLNLIVKGREYEEVRVKSSGKAYRNLEIIFLISLIALLFWALLQAPSLTLTAYIGFAISVGMINGILGFTLAHELIHRKSKLMRSGGYLLLLLNSYMHYGIEHVWGHHVYASTPKDPHTARKGQSFYTYLPWAIAKTFLNACEIETKKLTRKKRGWISWHNQIFQFAFLQFLLIGSIMYFLGWLAAGFYIIQSATSIILLHVVNYLQHYGLARKEVQPGLVERMDEHHAWHSGNNIKNFSLFQLENHAHHHMHPTHTFESLKHTDGSPVYPTGYSGMIVLAMFPGLWFRIVHKRLPFTQ